MKFRVIPSEKPSEEIDLDKIDKLVNTKVTKDPNIKIIKINPTDLSTQASSLKNK